MYLLVNLFNFKVLQQTQVQGFVEAF